jgi:hypothetical protein
MSSIQGIGVRTTQQQAPIKNMGNSVSQVEKGNEIPDGPRPPQSEFSGWEKLGNSAKSLYNGPAQEEMEKKGIFCQKEQKMSEESFNKIKETMNTTCDELLNFYKNNEDALKDKNIPPDMMAIMKGEMPYKMEMLYACSEIVKREGRELPPELQKKVNETLQLVNVIGFPYFIF